MLWGHRFLDAMHKTLLVLVISVANNASSASAAQSQDFPAPDALVASSEPDERYRWNLAPPWLGWRWAGSYGRLSGSVSIYFTYTAVGAAPGRPTRLQLVARQVIREGDHPDKVSWTESDRCPALMEAVQQFQEIAPPRTIIPGLTWPPQFPTIVLHGMNWTLWSNTAQQEGHHPASYSFSSNTGLIADWGDRTWVALEGCWGDQPPPPDF